MVSRSGIGQEMSSKSSMYKTTAAKTMPLSLLPFVWVIGFSFLVFESNKGVRGRGRDLPHLVGDRKRSKIGHC